MDFDSILFAKSLSGGGGGGGTSNNFVITYSADVSAQGVFSNEECDKTYEEVTGALSQGKNIQVFLHMSQAGGINGVGMLTECFASDGFFVAYGVYIEPTTHAIMKLQISHAVSGQGEDIVGAQFVQ